MTTNSASPLQVPNGPDLLDAEGLGHFLGLGNERPGSAARAIAARIERGHELPPCVEVPGLRGRRWLRSTVIRWLKRYEAPLRGRVGRPRKIDQLAMARQISTGRPEGSPPTY